MVESGTKTLLLIVNHLDQDIVGGLQSLLTLSGVHPQNVVIHYSYELPRVREGDEVIERHDALKEEAVSNLMDKAKRIESELSVNTRLNVVLGKTRSTVKRLLASSKTPIEYIAGLCSVSEYRFYKLLKVQGLTGELKNGCFLINYNARKVSSETMALIIEQIVSEEGQQQKSTI